MRNKYTERTREWVAGGLRGECVAMAKKFRSRSIAERVSFIQRANAAKAAGFPSWKAMQREASLHAKHGTQPVRAGAPHENGAPPDTSHAADGNIRTDTCGECGEVGGGACGGAGGVAAGGVAAGSVAGADEGATASPTVGLFSHLGALQEDLRRMAQQQREASQAGQAGHVGPERGGVNGAAAANGELGASAPSTPSRQAFLDVHSEQTSPWAQSPSRPNGRAQPEQGTLAHAAAVAFQSQSK